METKQFNITINAPREKVWDTLWSDATYREWTTPFFEGSYAVTDWQTGSKVLFLGPDGSGMVSTITENRPNEFMGITHLGEVKNGVETLNKEWKNAFENYRLNDSNGKTELRVDLNMSMVPQNFIDFMLSTFPKALDKVKEIAEREVLSKV